MRCSERPPAAGSRFAWLPRFHFGRRALSVAVAHLFLVRWLCHLHEETAVTLQQFGGVSRAIRESPDRKDYSAVYPHDDQRSSHRVSRNTARARCVGRRLCQPDRGRMILSPSPSNHAVERTATRRAFTTCVAKTPSLQSTRALGGRRSPCSR